MTSIAKHARRVEFKVVLFLLFVAVKAEGESSANAVPQENLSPFLFSYGVNDDETGNRFAHQQATDGQATQGQYRVALPDGRTQVVSYTADENGFNAVVTYEGVAVHPDDESSGGPVAARQPITSSPHPTRQQPVIPSPPVSQHVTPAHHIASPVPHQQQGGAFIKNEIPIPRNTRPAPHLEDSLLHHGTPVLPHITSPVPNLSDSFVRHGTPLPAPHHESSVAHHNNHVPLISRPPPLHKNPVPLFSNPGFHHDGSFLHHESLDAHISSPVPHHKTSVSRHEIPSSLISSPSPHHGGSILQFGNPTSLTSSNALHHGNLGSPHVTPFPLVSSPTPQHGSSHHESPFPIISSPAPHHRSSFLHLGTPNPLISSPLPPQTRFIPDQRGPGHLTPNFGPLHEGKISRLGSSASVISNPIINAGNSVPLVKSSTPHHENVLPRHENPISLISTPVPIHEEIISNHRNPHLLISSPIPQHGGSILQPRSFPPLISRTAIHRGHSGIGHGTPIPQVTTPVPHHARPLPHHINEIRHPPTHSTSFLSPTAHPESPKPFVSSSLKHQGISRPLQLPSSRDRISPLSGRSGIGRRSNFSKTLAPFLPGGPTLDREQYLRHKGILRSRAFLSKRNVET